MTGIEHHTLDAVYTGQALIDATRAATESYDLRINLLADRQEALEVEQAELRIATAHAPAGLRKALDDETSALAEYTAQVEAATARRLDFLEAWAKSTRRGRRRWRKLEQSAAEASD